MNDVDVEAWQTSACSCRIDLALSTVRPLRHRPLPSPCTARWAPTCRDRLIDYRSLFPAMKARRLAATTMAAPCGRTEPRLLVGAQSHSPDGQPRPSRVRGCWRAHSKSACDDAAIDPIPI